MSDFRLIVMFDGKATTVRYRRSHEQTWTTMELPEAEANETVDRILTMLKEEEE